MKTKAPAPAQDRPSRSNTDTANHTAADEFKIARKCRCCGRFLTRDLSVRLGVGPVCAERAEAVGR